MTCPPCHWLQSMGDNPPMPAPKSPPGRPPVPKAAACSPDAVRQWYERMGFSSHANAGEAIGVGRHAILRYLDKGAPLTAALAMAAVEARLKPAG